MDMSLRLKKSKEKVEHLRIDLENYQLKLDMLGFSDHDMKKHKSPTGTRGGKIIVNMLFLWPLSVLGVLLNSPVAILATVGGKLLARGEIVEAATYRIMVSILSLSLLYTTVPLVLWRYFGLTTALTSCVILPLTGLAAIKVRPLGSSVKFITEMMKIVPKDLRDERAKLKQRVIDAVDEFYDGPRMFYAKKNDLS